MWSIGFYASPIIRNYFGKIRGHIKKKKKEATDKNKTFFLSFLFLSLYQRKLVPLRDTENSQTEREG